MRAHLLHYQPHVHTDKTQQKNFSITWPRYHIIYMRSGSKLMPSCRRELCKNILCKRFHIVENSAATNRWMQHPATCQGKRTGGQHETESRIHFIRCHDGHRHRHHIKYSTHIFFRFLAYLPHQGRFLTPHPVVACADKILTRSQCRKKDRQHNRLAYTNGWGNTMEPTWRIFTKPHWLDTREPERDISRTDKQHSPTLPHDNGQTSGCCNHTTALGRLTFCHGTQHSMRYRTMWHGTVYFTYGA